MLDYLFDLYRTLVDRFILVLHPSFEEEVRQHCASHFAPTDYELQESPTGMLDATLIPMERVQRYRPTSVWITWCDQITVHPETILKLAELSGQDSETALIFPTVVREKPYTHIVRDDRNGIIDILHRREGDDLPEVGESDVGLFCLSGHAYLNLLPDFSCGVGRGTVTQERNFLPFIPWLSERAGVQTFPGRHEIESVGINTAADLNGVERYLRHEGKNLFNYYSRL